MRNKLTPKQAAFVIEYLVDMNATQAAIRAGYSEDSAGLIGAENISKPYIAEAIKEQLDARAARTLITADYVLSNMKELAERCMQRRAVVVFNKEEKKYEQATELVEHEDGTVTEEGVWQFDSAGANKALENLAKNLKILTDKVDLGGHDGGPLVLPPIQRVYVKSPDEIPNA